MRPVVVVVFCGLWKCYRFCLLSLNFVLSFVKCLNRLHLSRLLVCSAYKKNEFHHIWPLIKSTFEILLVKTFCIKNWSFYSVLINLLMYYASTPVLKKKYFLISSLYSTLINSSVKVSFYKGLLLLKLLL